MRVAKAKIDVEREKGKRSNLSVVSARSVMVEAFNLFNNSGRTYFRYVAKKWIEQPIFKSNLVAGMTNFDYSVFFHLLHLQAIDCYTCLFQSFSSRGWLAGELRNVHMDDSVEFVDELYHIYLESLVAGLVIDDMFRLCLIVLNSPKENNTQFVFNLYRFCLGHVNPSLPSG